MATDVRGLHVPLVTPFDEHGAVDLAALERLAVEVLDDGADGLVALATTAEASSLDERERDAVLAVCARVATDRGATLIVGAGTNDTRTTIARHEALAARRGVTASLAVVPYYVRPSEAAIVAHFQAVAARSPVPIVALQHPVPHGARARRAGAARAGRHRGHRRAQAGGRRGRRRHAGAAGRGARRLRCAVRRRRLPPPAARDGRAPERSPRSAHLCTERFAALLAGGGRRPVRRGARAGRGAAAARARAVRRAQPGGAQGDAARGRADRHPGGADAAAERLGGRPLARARRSAPSRSSARAPARAR